MNTQHTQQEGGLQMEVGQREFKLRGQAPIRRKPSPAPKLTAPNHQDQEAARAQAPVWGQARVEEQIFGRLGVAMRNRIIHDLRNDIGPAARFRKGPGKGPGSRPAAAALGAVLLGSHKAPGDPYGPARASRLRQAMRRKRGRLYRRRPLGESSQRLRPSYTKER